MASSSSGRKAAAPAKLVPKKLAIQKPPRAAAGSSSYRNCHSDPSSPTAMVIPAARLANRKAKKITKMRPMSLMPSPAFHAARHDGDRMPVPGVPARDHPVNNSGRGARRYRDGERFHPAEESQLRGDVGQPRPEQRE